jgi:hypothetical protein
MSFKIDVPNNNNNNNTININKSCMCCIYCGKSYKTRANIDKHLILCETIQRSKKNKEVSPNQYDIDLPSQRQMYSIILELTMKCNKLEEKVEQLTKWVDKKKKKINVLEWLHSNMIPRFMFDDLSDKISILDTDIECLLTNGFIETFNEILVRNIFEEREKQIIPIFCLDQKANTIYVYNIPISKNISSELEPCWMELERESLITFMNKLHKKIIKELIEWKKTLEKEKRFDDSKSELYNKTLMKIMNVNFKQDITINKFKSIIYGRMKTDMKALIEYEFEF